ncbi:MAG: pyridoxal-phosphate dependent enzyme [Thermoanaerobaculia bacterium]|nr:pyridoxal-phosphate dependent enzyme [Thermoanaerobaculia bacterium]
MLSSPALDRAAGLRCRLKAEHRQVTGAFKVRGALAALTDPRHRCHRSVVTASAGNFGQGVAFAAGVLGLEATVFVPHPTPDVKRRRIAEHGAVLRVGDTDFDETYDLARRWARSEGHLFLPPFDHARVIEGQGTLVREFLAQRPHLEALVVPCGGGGLLAGAVIALATVPHTQRPRLVAVEPACLPSLRRAVGAGRPVRLPADKTLADGIAVREVGALPLRIVRDQVDAIVTVDEGQLASAIRFLADELGETVEGAGAAAVAAVLARPPALAEHTEVGLLLTGGNIDDTTLRSTGADVERLRTRGRSRCRRPPDDLVERVPVA